MIIFFLINTILLLKANLDRPLDVSRCVLSFQFFWHVWLGNLRLLRSSSEDTKVIIDFTNVESSAQESFYGKHMKKWFKCFSDIVHFNLFFRMRRYIAALIFPSLVHRKMVMLKKFLLVIFKTIINYCYHYFFPGYKLEFCHFQVYCQPLYMQLLLMETRNFSRGYYEKVGQYHDALCVDPVRFLIIKTTFLIPSYIPSEFDQKLIFRKLLK